ncbi:MAG: hypothetical protein WD533_06455 [Dehalococcoidia bacterium]
MLKLLKVLISVIMGLAALAAMAAEKVHTLTSKVRITQNTDGVTLSDATATARTRIARFEVPDRTRYAIRAGDVFSLYADDGTTTPAELEDESRVELVRVQAGGNFSQVIVDTDYETVKEFVNRESLFAIETHMDLYPRDVLEIYVTSAAGNGDADTTRFQVGATQVSTVRL